VRVRNIERQKAGLWLEVFGATPKQTKNYSLWYSLRSYFSPRFCRNVWCKGPITIQYTCRRRARACINYLTTLSLWRRKKEEESRRRVQSLQTEVEKMSIIETETCTGVQPKAGVLTFLMPIKDTKYDLLL